MSLVRRFVLATFAAAAALPLALTLIGGVAESPESVTGAIETAFRGTARVIHLEIDTVRAEGHDIVGVPAKDKVELWGLHDGGTATTRVLYVFAAPKRMRGTGLMIEDRLGAPDDMWYHMKTWDHFKTIPSSSLKLLVPGSCLTYEEARGFVARDRYAVTAGPEGRLLARPRTPELAADLGFTELEIAVDRAKRLVTAIDTFAAPRRLVKTFRLDSSVRFGGITLPATGKVEDLQHATTSTLAYRYWPLPGGVPEAVFDRRIEGGPLFDRVLAVIRAQGIEVESQKGGS